MKNYFHSYYLQYLNRTESVRGRFVFFQGQGGQSGIESFPSYSETTEAPPPTAEEIETQNESKAEGYIESGNARNESLQNSTLVPPDLKSHYTQQRVPVLRGSLGTENVDVVRSTVLPGLEEILSVGAEQSESTETIPETTLAEISPENLAAYQELNAQTSELLEAKDFDGAISTLQAFIDQNRPSSVRRMAEMSLMDTMMHKIEDAKNTPGIWNEGGLEKFVATNLSAVSHRIDVMAQEGERGKELASFYLQTLYYQGRIDRQNPLFKQLVRLKPDFERREQADFKERIGGLEGRLGTLTEQLQNENLSDTERQRLLFERKSTSGRIVSRNLQRHFPQEFSQLALRTVEQHSVLQDWQGIKGETAKEKIQQADKALEGIHDDWQGLVDKLKEKGISIPSYTNEQGDESVIFSPILGREVGLEDGEAIPTPEERKMGKIMMAIDFTSIVGAVYTAGYGSFLAREGLKKAVRSAIIRDTLATTAVAGTAFSVSHNLYKNILTPISGQEVDWSVQDMVKDIPRDIALFTVMRGLTMKYNPTLERSVHRLANPIAQTGIEAGTLVGFTQGERALQGESPQEMLQHLPDDVLYSVAFLVGLKGVNFAVNKIEARRNAETGRSETVIGYSADRDVLLEMFRRSGSRVDAFEDGRIRVVNGRDTTIFEPTNSRGLSEREMGEFMKLNEGIDNIDTLKQNSEILHFPYVERTIDGVTRHVSTRGDFVEALEGGNLAEAKRIYRESLVASIERFEKMGFTIEENAQLVEAFRTRNAGEVKRLIQLARERKPTEFADNDTSNQYHERDPDTGEVLSTYDNTRKMLLPDPVSGREEMMTRRELHQRIREVFIPSDLPRPAEPVFYATGGMPGSGKGTALEAPIGNLGRHVHVDPDAIKPYLPEYRRPDGTVDGSIVHRESGDIAHEIFEEAMRRGHPVLYDASMRDDPSASWYSQIIEQARDKGYKIEAGFVFDGGEAWHRNSILRDRMLPADGYLNFLSGFGTIRQLGINPKVDRVTIYDNSGRTPKKIIVYEKGEVEWIDEGRYEAYEEYDKFRKKLQSPG